MSYNFEYEILIGIILGASFIILLLTFLLEKFFPKSKVSKLLSKILDFIRQDIRV